MTDSALTKLAGLARAARLDVPDDLAALLVSSGAALGADQVRLLLVDREQYLLVPVPTDRSERLEPLVEATLAGRCFRQLALQTANDGLEVWVPLLDGLERLGVIRLRFPHVSARPTTSCCTTSRDSRRVVLVKGAYG
jgi:hypothetical protein